jgi:hypothetical protein
VEHEAVWCTFLPSIPITSASSSTNRLSGEVEIKLAPQQAGGQLIVHVDVLDGSSMRP